MTRSIVSAFCSAFAMSLVLLALGCDEGGELRTPPSLDRPGTMALVCYDTATTTVRPLADCDGLASIADEPLAMMGLVTQTARGEVAAVRLRDSVVIDSDQRVPGFTFHRVGESPTGIVVLPAEPTITYVAAFGDRTVEWYETSSILTGKEGFSGSVSLEEGPSDLLATSDGAFFYATLPVAGRVVELQRQGDGSLSITQTFDLLPPASAPTAAVETDQYERICPTTRALKTPIAVSPQRVSGAVASPIRAVLDETVSPPMLLVADAELPFVHRFEILAGGASPIAPVHTGVPVSDIAVTPTVPALVGDDAASAPSRYLYAISAYDGSVLVVDYETTSPTFGSILSFGVGHSRADRLMLSAPARRLAVLSPGFPGADCTLGSNQAAESEPYRLRGVFLAVGLSDGSVRIIDVYDRDATCRGGDASCSSPPNATDLVVGISRHHPRIGAYLQQPLGVVDAPDFSFDGVPAPLREDGYPSRGEGPGLTALSGCPPLWTSLYPEPGAGAPLICALDDPWATRAETWTATWQGSIPGASGATGRLVDSRDSDGDGIADQPGTWLSAPGQSFCSRGVIDAEIAAALPADDPLLGYGGDRLVVTTSLPDASATNPACSIFVSDAGQDPIRPTFAVAMAYDNDLGLGAALGTYDFQTVRQCFPGLLSYQVQVRGAYRVSGSSTGTLHRSGKDASDRCTPSPSLAIDPANTDTLRVFRAFEGRLFQNVYVSFQISEPTPVGTTSAVLSFGLDNVAPGVGLSLRASEEDSSISIAGIVEEMLFSPQDQRFYVVDSHGDRIVQYGMDPWRETELIR